MIKVIVITLLLATALSKYEDDRINKQNPIPVHFVITHRGTQLITPTLFTQATCQSSRTSDKSITCLWNQTVDQATTILWPCGSTEALAAHHFSVTIDSKNSGYLQEIGPFYLEDGANYKPGDNLTENKNAWTKISNLLFMESPAGVGFSFNTDSKF